MCELRSVGNRNEFRESWEIKDKESKTKLFVQKVLFCSETRNRNRNQSSILQNCTEIHLAYFNLDESVRNSLTLS